jgi:hypothetical protein
MGELLGSHVGARIRLSSVGTVVIGRVGLNRRRLLLLESEQGRKRMAQ